ncbi:hypothetical protein GM3708_1241 [Geminocystis sp. NIES-3708]|uniref:hypothetical protein n=1 Tax=Geminocystis sp. NIES-3708 TaxID=1615909 RepID=UPI0005FC75BF|nr:hypothetical protein [Geminocystis sp. NIES-3708]BAQ60835.1 hypothetical protein GM3708_1241 [Geminocystis sp. NIES-3708]
MSNNNDVESLKINSEKLAKFKKLCAKKEINYLVIIENFIDSCLENNQVTIDDIFNKNDNINIEEKINLILSESLQPLIARIEKLESQLKENNNYLQKENLSNLPPLLSNLPQEDISKRVYLPRQEVWQRLKKTDYIRYFGYDSFLKTKGDELIEYGIFFDENKKRFYIINN